MIHNYNCTFFHFLAIALLGQVGEKTNKNDQLLCTQFQTIDILQEGHQLESVAYPDEH